MDQKGGVPVREEADRRRRVRVGERGVRQVDQRRRRPRCGRPAGSCRPARRSRWAPAARPSSRSPWRWPGRSHRGSGGPAGRRRPPQCPRSGPTHCSARPYRSARRRCQVPARRHANEVDPESGAAAETGAQQVVDLLLPQRAGGLERCSELRGGGLVLGGRRRPAYGSQLGLPPLVPDGEGGRPVVAGRDDMDGRAQQRALDDRAVLQERGDRRRARHPRPETTARCRSRGRTAPGGRPSAPASRERSAVPARAGAGGPASARLSSRALRVRAATPTTLSRVPAASRLHCLLGTTQGAPLRRQLHPHVRAQLATKGCA